MTTNNKYENMSVFEALKKVDNHYMLLPEIQREFVWTNNEIEQLFESIISGYPIGSFIIWVINKQTLNNNKPVLYYFLRDYCQADNSNEKAPEYVREDEKYYVVLDGQQRITSLNIALYGSYTSFIGGSGHRRDDLKSWVKKKLYYNLHYYELSENSSDDETTIKRVSFLSDQDAKADNWYEIKQIVKYDTLDDFKKEIKCLNIPEEAEEDLCVLYQRLNDSSDNALIHYYAIIDNDYDKALDIFVRVNSTGRKLSKSDLIFSKLVDGWNGGGKDNIDNTIKIMNNKGDHFRFNRDYLMKLALVLVDASPDLKIQSLTNTTVNTIQSKWIQIKESAEKMVDILVDVGLSDETLTSYNATIPICYYIFKGGTIKNDGKKEVKKYLSIAMAKSLFGSSGNNSLISTRSALSSIDCKKTQFSVSLFDDVKFSGGRTFKVDEKEIERWLEFQKGQTTYVLLSLLYPHYKLNRISFHQDHCHPYAAFERKYLNSLSITYEKQDDWRKKRNLLPNLQFLTGSENCSKNKTPLKEWVEKGNSDELLPKSVSLEIKDFDEFFEARKKLIKEKLMLIFDLKYTN